MCTTRVASYKEEILLFLINDCNVSLNRGQSPGLASQANPPRSLCWRSLTQWAATVEWGCSLINCVGWHALSEVDTVDWLGLQG